jgi:hypothetical protein
MKAPNGWISRDLYIWNELDRRGFVSKGFVPEIPDLRRGSNHALDSFHGRLIEEFVELMQNPPVKGVEIDGDRIVEERQRGQRPEKAAPRALRTALEDNEIVEVSVGEEPEVPPCLDALMPAVLVDGFLRPELANRVVLPL